MNHKFSFAIFAKTIELTKFFFALFAFLSDKNLHIDHNFA